MDRTQFLTVSTALCLTMVSATKAAAEGWPDTIDLLTEARSHAQACMDEMRNSGDASAISAGRDTYNAAKAAADGAIAGFTTGLVQGYRPEDLPRIQSNVERAGAKLEDFCNAAIRASAAAKGSRGVLSDILKQAIGPVVDALKSAAGAPWSRHVEMAKLETETIRGQLQEAKWPEYGSQ